MRKADPEKIGWADRVVNPIKCECRHKCRDLNGKIYCYMEPLYRVYGGWPKEPELVEKQLRHIRTHCKAETVFVGDSTDMFGDWVPSDMIEAVLDAVRTCTHCTFYFLTKNPKRYTEFIFPGNCWLGVTIDRDGNDIRANRMRPMQFLELGGKRFVSAEPVLDDIWVPVNGVLPDWLIIGADSRKGAEKPQREWIDNLVDFADEQNIPVFIKWNLAKQYPRAHWRNRREKPCPGNQ